VPVRKTAFGALSTLAAVLGWGLTSGPTALAQPVALAASASSQATSNNWSGYVMTGSGYTSVTGTFTVPKVVRYVAGSTVSEWVGIDGWDNASLIQAGVNEIPMGPGVSLVEPWWQVLPYSQRLATGVMTRAGDTVSVTIGEKVPGTWAITLADDTNGDVFTKDYRYSGPLTSAEWVVEANSQLNGDVTTLAKYGPAIDFTGLGISGQPGGSLSRVVMVQAGTNVSTPSSLSPAGFTVAYGGPAPTTPALKL
jgi:hypothetical protein